MGGQQKDFISDIVFFQHQDGMRLKVWRHFLQCNDILHCLLWVLSFYATGTAGQQHCMGRFHRLRWGRWLILVKSISSRGSYCLLVYKSGFPGKGVFAAYRKEFYTLSSIYQSLQSMERLIDGKGFFIIREIPSTHSYITAEKFFFL